MILIECRTRYCAPAEDVDDTDDWMPMCVIKDWDAFIPACEDEWRSVAGRLTLYERGNVPKDIYRQTHWCCIRDFDESATYVQFQAMGISTYPKEI